MMHFSFASLASDTALNLPAATSAPLAAGHNWAWLRPLSATRPTLGSWQPVGIAPRPQWREETLVQGGCLPPVRPCQWAARAAEYYRANAGSSAEPTTQRFCCPNKTTNQISFTKQSTK
jgi:hypothetical protein